METAMTKNQYAKYQGRVERGLKGLEHVSTGPCPGCNDCGLSESPTEAEYDAAQDGGFSWSGCDVCGSGLGGTRHPAHGFRKMPEGPDRMIHLNVCSDCLHFIEYGQLDDTAMMDIERGEE